MSRGANLTTLKTKVTSLNALTLNSGEFNKVSNYIETLKRAFAIKLVLTTNYNINIKANVLYLTLNLYYNLKAIAWYKRKLRKIIRPNRRKKVTIFRKHFRLQKSKNEFGKIIKEVDEISIKKKNKKIHNIDFSYYRPITRIYGQHKYKKWIIFKYKKSVVKRKVLNSLRKKVKISKRKKKLVKLNWLQSKKVKDKKKQKKYNQKNKKRVSEKKTLSFNQRKTVAIKSKEQKLVAQQKKTKTSNKKTINLIFTFKKLFFKKSFLNSKNKKINSKIFKKKKLFFITKKLSQIQKLNAWYFLWLKRSKTLQIKHAKKLKKLKKIKQRRKLKNKKNKKHAIKLKKKQIKQLKKLAQKKALKKQQAKKKAQQKKLLNILLKKNIKKKQKELNAKEIRLKNTLENKLEKRLITSQPILTKKQTKNILFSKNKTKINKFNYKFFGNLNNKMSIVIKTKVLNKKVNKPITCFLTQRLKSYKRILFNRRFHFFYDVVKLSALILKKKIPTTIYIKIIGQIFKKLPKTLHNKFLKFLRELILFLTGNKIKQIAKHKLQGIKFIINGKLKGKMRANVWNFSHGRLLNQSVNTFIEYSNTTVNTMYGSFGFSAWFSFFPKYPTAVLTKMNKEYSLEKKNIDYSKISWKFYKKKLYQARNKIVNKKKVVIPTKAKKAKIKKLFAKFTRFLKKQPTIKKTKILTQTKLQTNLRIKELAITNTIKKASLKIFSRKLYLKRKPKKFYIKRWYKKKTKKKVPTIELKKTNKNNWKNKKPSKNYNYTPYNKNKKNYYNKNYNNQTKNYKPNKAYNIKNNEKKSEVKTNYNSAKYYNTKGLTDKKNKEKTLTKNFDTKKNKKIR